MSTARPKADRAMLPWLASELSRVVSGNARALAAGLPALLVAAAAGSVAYQASAVSNDLRLAAYSREAGARLDAGDLDAARTCFERLIRDLGARPEHRYGHALTLRAAGERARADAIIDALAPDDRPGYAPAHLDVARRLSEGPDPPPMALRQIELHLTRALDGPVGEEAGARLGLLYAATGRADQAEPYLIRASDRQPELLLVLARLAHDRGEAEKQEGWLREGARVFRERAGRGVDDPAARLNWSACASLLGDYPGAVAILEAGLKLSDDPRYHRGLAAIYDAWAGDRARSAPATAGDPLALVERGLAHDPDRPGLLDRMSTILRAGGPDADRARAALQARLADGKATAMTHFVLGVDAIGRGLADPARLHWEQALRLDPGMAVVANNLAWTLAHATPPDLPRARELADRAVRAQPGDARFRGTRGVVLMKLGRWAEALTDLEAELAADPGRRDTHRALAEVYQALGSPELAARHRDRAAAGGPVASPPAAR